MSKIDNLIAAGGKRWQKNGNDRIYLSKAIKGEDGMSNKVRNAFYSTVDRAYYDVVTDELIYSKSAWQYVNDRIESEFARICVDKEENTMKKTYFWTAESWGSSEVPENVNDIIDTANDMIAAYLDETGDEDATAEYSVTLWDRYCTTGSLKDPQRFTKSWKVYGADGHRQRESFGPSVRYDFSDSNGIRLIDVLNADKTGTNEYSIVTITRNTEQECDQEFAGQISDGIFENSRVGRIEVI